MFLKSLNPSQSEAVTFGDGPLLILAGAGSGKTKVLTSRIAYLVLHKGVPPENIMAVTFTNKAAGEMRERLAKLIGAESRSVWLGTFHSIGLRLLRKESRAAGITNDLIVYGEDEQLALIKQVMGELSINEKAFAPKVILSRINQAKNSQIGPSDFAKQAGDFLSEKVSKVYSLYQKKLREMGCMDFGDLICEPVNLLRQNAHIMKHYQERFQYLLVDEFQDTNKAQYIFTSILAGGTRNLLAVGDPDQSIYAWRGADISNILEFQADYPDSTVLRLEQNYRSTKNILSAANSVIENNLKRLKKSLWTENIDGSPLTYEEAKDEYNEAEIVIKRIKSLLNERRDVAYKEMAIFYRTNAQSRVFEEKLIREGIPYSVVGGVRFYDRKEIKDAIAYLRVIANPNDAISLQRIINTPPRGVGKATIDKVLNLSNTHNIPLFEAFKDALERGMLAKTKVKDLIEALEEFRINIGSLALHERTLRLLEDSGYMLMWQEEGSEESLERIDNLFELVSAIKDFEHANPGAALTDFLDQVALISDLDNYEDSADRLTLMTLHSAKGLEFKAVFLAGMEEGLFPHSRSINSTDELEEERRLCYVGMTRAREHLYLYSAKTRNIYGEARYQLRSRFIDEIPSALISFTGPEVQKKHIYTDEPYYSSEGSQIEHAYADNQDFEPQPWRVGMKVKHPSFGVGIIKERTGVGEEMKLTVSFQSAGMKKLVVKYASLTPLS